MQKVTPFLWFKTEAEEAAKFYVTLVKNSKILGKGKSAHDATRKKGSVFSVRFTFDGHEYIAFNGGRISSSRRRFPSSSSAGSEGGRPPLEQARRQGVALRLDLRQIRAFVADHTEEVQRPHRG
jgi:hypothetical protein